MPIQILRHIEQQSRVDRVKVSGHCALVDTGPINRYRGRIIAAATSCDRFNTGHQLIVEFLAAIRQYRGIIGILLCGVVRYSFRIRTPVFLIEILHQKGVVIGQGYR